MQDIRHSKKDSFVPTQALTASRPQTWVEVSRSALEHNLRLYKQALGNKSALGIVVKSNAYGHGILEVSRICQESSSADWLFTATSFRSLISAH